MRSGAQPRIALALLFALAACLALAACGGSSKKAAPQAPFVRQADAICAQGAALMRALPQASGLARVAVVGRQGRAIIARYTARLEALRPPASKAGEFNIYLSALRRELDNEDAIVAAARAHDKASVKSLQAARTGYVRHSHDLGLRLGLARCYG